MHLQQVAEVSNVNDCMQISETGRIALSVNLYWEERQTFYIRLFNNIILAIVIFWREYRQEFE
jgi:hypothetical protein